MCILIQTNHNMYAIVPLFLIRKNGKQSKCSSAREGINKLDVSLPQNTTQYLNNKTTVNMLT